MSSLVVKYQENDDNQLEELHYMCYNADGRLLSIATKTGFAVFTTKHMKEVAKRDIGSGIRLVGVLRASNVFAIVGDGSNEQYPSSSVILWNEGRGVVIAEVKFDGVIRGLRMHGDFMIVVLDDTCHVYVVDTLRRVFTFSTAYNPDGLVSVVDGGEELQKQFGTTSALVVLALPSRSDGKDHSPSSVGVASAVASASSFFFGGGSAAAELPPLFAQIHFIACSASSEGVAMTVGASSTGTEEFEDAMSASVMKTMSEEGPHEVCPPVVIKLHENAKSIAQIALSPNGLLLASASSNGTRVIVFGTVRGNALRVFRRGAASADIYSLAFCPAARYLCAASNSETVHIFDLHDRTDNKGLIDWSIRAAEERRAVVKALIPLSAKHTQRLATLVDSPARLLVACTNGETFEFSLDPTNGTAQRIAYRKFADKHA